MLSSLAQNHWTHRIQAPFTCLQSSHNYPTSIPPYLHNLISVQRPRSTRSSSVVNFARPPTSSYLRITDRSFRYASPCLWNQLPLSLRRLYSGTSSSISDSPVSSSITSSSLDSPLCSSIPPFFLSLPRLKTYLFHKSFLGVSLLPPKLPSRTIARPFLLSYSVFVFSFSLFFITAPCARLSLP